MSGSQFTQLKMSGINSYANPLSAVPDGSMADAVNINIDRNQVAEPRRGLYQYGTTFGNGNDRAKQLFNYKDVILRHVLTNIQYDSDLAGDFINFTGPSITEVNAGLRIKGTEVNGNFYFCTLSGVKKLSARNSADFPNISIQEAGGIKALDVTATPNYTNNGFLDPNSKVAYRIVWGKEDLNENLILGTPSNRAVVYNVSTTNSCIVDLEFAVPSDVVEGNFYQVYRTAVFTGQITPTLEEPVDPGDEMFLVLEDTVTPSEITAGVVDIQDITPEEFRKSGALLYTNPESGDGIEQANEKPPFAQDIALYKNYTFYANTKTVQRLNLSFLSVVDFVDNASTFVVSDGISTNTYYFQGSLETYTMDFTGSAAADFYNGSAGTAKYVTLTSANDERNYLIWWYKSANDQEPSLPGYLNIKVDISAAANLSNIIDTTAEAILAATNDFNISRVSDTLVIPNANNGYVTVNPVTTVVTPFDIQRDGNGTGEDAANNKIFLPRVPTGTENGPTTSQQLEQVATSLVNVLNKQDNIVVAFYSSGFNDVPGKFLLEQQVTTGPVFWVNSNEGQEFNPTLPASGSSLSSTNEVSPNRIYYSKLQQPEAVPLLNYLDVGPKDREIKRIIPLRDSLFIFKEDGIYRLSGDTAPFTVAPFDFSTQVLAPDTAVVLNNQIYALSTQGVCQISDTQVQIISRPIENQLLKVTRTQYAYKTASFGISYETDRSFILFVPTIESDVVATQAFRYNTFTSTWTKWNKTQTCGLVNFADDKLYMGAGDANFIEKERKTLTRADHADRQYELEITLNGVGDKKIVLNDTDKAEVGDVLIQSQYLTASQFNRLLDKLDRDIGVVDDNYLSTLQYLAGEDMRTKLILLANKLDNDAGVDYNEFANDIGDLTYTITNIAPSSSQAVLTTSAPHNIKVNRYININGTNSNPAITGTYEVIAVTSNTITINKTLTSGGTTGTLQTAVNDFKDMQACYNIITNLLNNDNKVFFTNYPTSTGTNDFEIVILAVNDVDNSVTVKFTESFLFGEIILYKAIPTSIIWNPSHFGDPSTFKQVREGTMMFENSNFSKATISYATDLSPGFAPVIFQGPGLSVGDFGYFEFGTINFGGVSAPIPLRTYVPGTKQRCRFMNVKFEHKVAFEKYSIYGLSLTHRTYSTRAYR